MNQIKVAHITNISAALKGLLLNQMDSLQQAGYDVFGISSPGPEVADLNAAGLHHISVPITRNISPVDDLKTLWKLYRLMRRERFTIVHTHFSKPGLLGQLAAKMAAVPIIINTIHGYYFHEHMPPRQRRFYIQIEKVAARCSDLILSQNREDLRTTLKEGISAPEKVKYLGNGIDLKRFCPDQVTPRAVQQMRAELGIADDAVVIGYVGRLAAKRKGLHDLLLAGQQIVAEVPNACFLIVGKSDHGRPDAVKAIFAEKYGLEEHCIFTGWQPNHIMPLIMKLMDVLVLPSLFEGIPRAIMEASAMGIPVVATDVRGNREAVEHNVSGLLVPLHDVEALAEAIIDLATDQAKADRFGREGQRLAQQLFDERLVFKKIEAEYARLLQEKGLHKQSTDSPQLTVQS